MNILLGMLFWVGFAGVVGVWLLYPLALWFVSRFVVRARIFRPTPVRTVTVLVAAHNEEFNILSRLDNIHGTGSADFEVSVVIALDRSTDRTAALIDKYREDHPGRRVEFFETAGKGKASAHNEALSRIKSDLVLFTDADTQYEPGFIDAIGHAFDDQRVGFCSGQLAWRGKDTPEGASYFPLYWKFETFLRNLESRLGICVVGTGACCAMRTSLFVKLHATSDADCSSPLDVVQQGYLCVVEPRARAVDYVADTVRGEFRGRVRMTSKNLLNTLTSWNWRRSTFVLPFETLGLIFHKIGRWLTPFFVVAILIAGSGLFATGQASVLVAAVTLTGMGICLAAIVGFLLPQLPVLGALGSFGMANVAFAIGTVRVLRGAVPSHFEKVR